MTHGNALTALAVSMPSSPRAAGDPRRPGRGQRIRRAKEGQNPANHGRRLSSSLACLDMTLVWSIVALVLNALGTGVAAVAVWVEMRGSEADNPFTRTAARVKAHTTRWRSRRGAVVHASMASSVSAVSRVTATGSVGRAPTGDVLEDRLLRLEDQLTHLNARHDDDLSSLRASLREETFDALERLRSESKASQVRDGLIANHGLTLEMLGLLLVATGTLLQGAVQVLG